ncbi:MAG: three-Cys-motif partner protein TcmP [Candidatus Hodarchaeota archaeon]
MIPEAYLGREHSYVKHGLLKAYLKRLFMILGQVENSICFVDCFAGPWSSQEEDLKDTSIGIVFDIMRKCREGLWKIYKRDVQFRSLFIEKTESAFEKLECFCDDKSCEGIDLNCRRGEFIDMRNEILNWCGKDFAFFFIDPTGWKNVVEISTLKKFFQRDRSEFLINFMFSFIVRAITQERHKDDIKAIFGEIPNTQGMSPKQKESYLLYRYRENAKAAFPKTGGSPRSAYVKVEHPLHNRTKYDLVYLTRSPKGIVVFIEESEKIDWVQRNIRAEIQQQDRIQRSGQLELPLIGVSTIGDLDRPDIETVKNYWLQKLSIESRQFGTSELADMVEETGWFISDFQRAFKELEYEGRVDNLNSIRSRPKHPVHFDANKGIGELLRKT